MSQPQSQPQPTPAQRAWMDLGYGMFLHFGPNTFAGTGWGDGKFPASKVDLTTIDCRQWAETAVKAGMKYGVLTTKHHDGFCLWPSRKTEYCVRHAPGQVDVVGRFVEAFRAAGLKVGFYYSLWDMNYPQYQDDAAYAQYMQDQMTELLTNYGPIVQVWFDGGWDKDHPTKKWYFDPAWDSDPQSGLRHGEPWKWKELYAHIHRLQSDCLVIQNSSSDRPGIVKYHPVDARTSEHFDFVWQGKVCNPLIDPIFKNDQGKEVFLPLEFNTTLSTDWFSIKDDSQTQPSADAICDWRRRAQAAKANLLLNVGPDKQGRIPEYHRQRLIEAAKRFKASTPGAPGSADPAG